MAEVEPEPKTQPESPAESEHAHDDRLAEIERQLTERKTAAVGPKALHWEVRFPGLYLVFVALNLADLLITRIAVNQTGSDEANRLAKQVLVRFGFVGLLVYKVALTTLVIALTEVIARNKPRWGFRLIVFGCIAFGFVVLVHILNLVT